MYSIYFLVKDRHIITYSMWNETSEFLWNETTTALLGAYGLKALPATWFLSRCSDCKADQI